MTGKPVWPIEERPVPQTDVPGERTSPTQPFPTKPPPFDRQGITMDDLLDFTPALKAEALKIARNTDWARCSRRRSSSTPAAKNGDHRCLPTTGGANWQGGAADPETGMLYVVRHVSERPSRCGRDAERTDMDYVGRPTPLATPAGVADRETAWGRITAIDLNTGEHAWMIPNGEAPAAMKSSGAERRRPEQSGKPGPRAHTGNQNTALRGAKA